MVRAIMHGCNGKMGQTITNICANDAEIEIVAGIDTYDRIQNTYPVFPSLQACDVEADVVKCGRLLQCSVRHQNFPMLVCQEIFG